MNDTTKPLSRRCVLARIHTSMWQGEMLERKAADFVTREMGSNRGAAKVTKTLVPKSMLKAMSTARGAVGAAHYERTAPWDGNAARGGYRLLSSPMIVDYLKAIREAKGKYDAAVTAFLAEYDEFRVGEAARGRLGDMYREGDYPTVESLRDRFAAWPEIIPVPTVDGWSVDGVDDDEAERLRDSLASRLEEAENLVRSHWTDLFDDTLRRIHKTLVKGGAIRKSTVRRLADLTDNIVESRIDADPNLVEIADEMRRPLVELASDAAGGRLGKKGSDARIHHTQRVGEALARWESVSGRKEIPEESDEGAWKDANEEEATNDFEDEFGL